MLHAAAWYSKNVLEWDDFGLCLDSPVGYWSFCCKVMHFILVLFSHSLVIFLIVIVVLNSGMFSKMDWRIRLKLGILFLFACFFAPLGFLLMSSPNPWPNLPERRVMVYRRNLLSLRQTRISFQVWEFEELMFELKLLVNVQGYFISVTRCPKGNWNIWKKKE